MSVFDAANRVLFARHYPEGPHLLRHSLGDHALLSLDALAALGEALPPASVEYNRSDLPIGIDPADVPANGLSIGETILRVHETGSWAVLKNIEQMPQYEALLDDLLGELRGEIERRTGHMLRPQGYVFVSSPHSVTPFHFDPEHNILLNLAGHKTLTQFPAGDERFAPATAHEAYHNGGHRNLVWDDGFHGSGMACDLGPGDAVFVPVMAPHFVKVGATSAISLSITWRSEWSFAEADARSFNRLARRLGMKPRATRRFPSRNLLKASAFRAIRKVGLERLAQ